MRQQNEISVDFVEALHKLSDACVGADAARSLQLNQEAYDVALALADKKLQAISLWQIGWIQTSQGQIDQSLSNVTKAHLLAQEIKDQLVEARTAYILGAIHITIGNYADVLQYQTRALELARAVGNRSLEADCLNMIGGQCSESGNHSEAITHFAAAWQIYQEAHSDHEAVALTNMADCYTQMHDFGQALFYGELALSIARRDKITWLGPLLRTLGSVHLEMGEGDAALAYFQQANDAHLGDKVNGEILSEHDHIALMIEIGKAHVLRKAEDEARRIWIEALDKARRCEAKSLQMKVHEVLYQSDKTLGHLDSALKHHEAWAELKQEIFNVETDRRLKTLQVMHDTKEAQRAAEILRLKTTELEFMVQTRTRALEASQIEMLERLAVAIEARDSGTGDHIKRVGALAANLAARLGLDAETIELIRLAAPLHDIGKISIPDNILLKRKELTPTETEMMREHTVVGAKMLSHGTSKLLRMAEAIALSHHERWDGVGYPHQLTGEMIPLPGRIVAVADAYDAIVHARPYKQAIPREQALSEIARCAGTQFDPNVVSALLALEQSQDRSAMPPAMPPENIAPRS